MILEAILTKRASAATDYLGHVASNIMLPGSSLVGGVHGFLEDLDKDEIKQLENNKALAFAPGVGASRLIRRQRAVDRAAGHSNGTFHRAASPIVNTILMGLLGAGAGAGVGAYLNSKYPYKEKNDKGEEVTDNFTNRQRLIGMTLGGGAIGAGLSGGASLLGTLLAGVTDRRSMAEQKALAKKPMHTISQYLVPGKGAYDWYKAYGSSNELA